MSLADILSDDQFTARSLAGPRCGIAVLLETLPEADAVALSAALENPNIQHIKIGEALHRSGHKVSAQTVKRHRLRGLANGCRCPR